ncbi:MAG: tRNA (N6-isopentenyl adenosine(37)-C2)-methylthiotransferase MiaB [Candidatus Eiseniibacteriota bacterium]
MKRFYLESFGCQMNVYDTQGMDRLLVDHGYARVGAPEEADVILVNTCSVREHAEERTLNRLAVLTRLKSKNPGLTVGVTGCMAQRMGEEIRKRVRGVDLVVGAQAFPEVLPALERLRAEGGVESFPVPRREPAHVVPLDHFLPPPGPPSDGPPLKSFVTIIRGCNKACAYCIVPTTRGPEVSRPADDIVREVEALVRAGAREVMLLGQNVNSYGADGVDFPELLRLCGAIEGKWRLRFTTSHPRDMSRDVLDRMSRVPRLAPWLHLPVQSGSRRVLRAMNRDYSLDHYLEVVDAARASIPDLALSSDIIVGFPGETIEDFEETIRLIERVRYDTFYVFKYSPRSGTAAAARPDDVSAEEKQRRLAILLEIQRRLSHEVNQAWVGRTLDVLVEGRDPKRGNWLTRTAQNKIVVLPGDDGEVPVGAFRSATIERAEGQTLYGRLAEVA